MVIWVVKDSGRNVCVLGGWREGGGAGEREGWGVVLEIGEFIS